MPNLDVEAVLISQYRATLKMFSQAVAQCPESLWLSSAYLNQYWHIAYHALFYTHLYLHPGEAEFRPWAEHRQDCRFLGPAPGLPENLPKPSTPYSQAEILDYLAVCNGEVEALVRAVDLASPSGFSWLPFSRMELHLYNLRHLQHHTGQLIERLRNAANIGIGWVRSG